MYFRVYVFLFFLVFRVLDLGFGFRASFPGVMADKCERQRDVKFWNLSAVRRDKLRGLEIYDRYKKT